MIFNYFDTYYINMKDIVSVPGRRIDDFGTRIKILMSRTEDYLVYTEGK